MSAGSKDSNLNNACLQGVTGIILAGGKSSRYGRNKAFVEMEGIRLIERVIGVLEPLFEHLLIITNTPDEYAYLHLPMVEDLVKGLGPLGGILTGLEAISDETGFFVACDMPFLNHKLIRHMVASREDFDAVVPRIDWKIEALHTLYRKSCLTSIRELIDTQNYQVINFFNKIRVKYLDEQELRSFDPQLRSFFNINKPEELAAAKKSWFLSTRP